MRSRAQPGGSRLPPVRQIYLLAVYWFAKYAAGLGIDASEVACEAMALYGGQSSAKMRAEVEAWWAEECEHRLRPVAQKVLDRHRARGDRCVLCTASWQHVAACAKASFQLDDVNCSVIEVGPDGAFTGKVRRAAAAGEVSARLGRGRAAGRAPA